MSSRLRAEPREDAGAAEDLRPPAGWWPFGAVGRALRRIRSMPTLHLLGTTAFRVTLLHLLLTLLGTAALSGLAWWVTTSYALREVRADLLHDAEVLRRAAARAGGAEGIAGLVEARVATDRDGTHYFLLAGADGGPIAGNLYQAPRRAGWQDIDLRRQGTGDEDGDVPPLRLLAYGTPLQPSGFLVVARDLTPVHVLEARLRDAAGWVGGGALLLGVLGGLVLSRSVLHRVAGMEGELAAVEQGAIERRLSVRSGGDEFDRLAVRINRALDRIQELMTTLRGVTDDIAHDLRTPLGRMRRRLEAAQRRADSEAEWAEAVEAAIEDCDRILGIFAALLRIAEIEGGARRAAFRPFDLSEVTESVAEVFLPAAEAREQTLAAAIAPGIAVLGDRDLVAQMVANLLDNAVRHGRAGGSVRLSLAPDGAAPHDAATLVVEDDGPGIPAAERTRVFRRFHRLDPARTTPGTGLGLSLVKAVADLHDMRLDLSDAGPGLRVTVRIPVRPG